MSKRDLKQAIRILDAEKEIFDKTDCEVCGKVQKTIYHVKENEYDSYSLCGKCLIKNAVGWIEHCEGGWIMKVLLVGGDYDY